MTPDRDELSVLSMREQQALRALVDKREIYRAGRQYLAAHAMSVAIFLVWQVFKREHGLT
jgi:hypothetical protein